MGFAALYPSYMRPCAAAAGRPFVPGSFVL